MSADLNEIMSTFTEMCLQRKNMSDASKTATRSLNDLNFISPEKSIVGGIGEKIDEQNELVLKQIEILSEQNKFLADNYNKLKDLYDAQVQATKDAKDDLQESRKYNRRMMVVSVIAMLAAIASPIVTILVS